MGNILGEFEAINHNFQRESNLFHSWGSGRGDRTDNIIAVRDRDMLWLVEWIPD